MKDTNDIKNRIFEKLKILNGIRPISVALIGKLREQFSLEMNYNSNAIEGNTLTMRETMMVIQEGITIKNKPLKDHLEAKNQSHAINYLYDVVARKKDIDITEHLIRQMHTLIIQSIDGTVAGAYRDHDVRISGSKHIPPGAFDVPNKMKSLIDWYRKNKNDIDAVTLATEFKHKFVAIHPFGDGNGRVSRLLMNIILMRAGLPIAVILKNDRSKYYKALQSADKGKIDGLIFVICQAVERSLDIYLRTLLPSSKMTQILPIANIATHTKYSAEYLGHLIRKGKIAGVKDGRNWKTSVEAVRAYVISRQRKR